MKKETGIRCENCRRKGVKYSALFSVQVSKIEESQGHRVYECDKCHGRYKFINSQEAK